MKKKIQQFIIAYCLFIPSVYGQDQAVVLLEDFNNNTLNWDIDSYPNYSSSIYNGKYTMNNNSDGVLAWLNDLNYNIGESFTIETKLSFKKIGAKGITFISNFANWETSFFGVTIIGDKAKATYYTGNQYANGGVYENITTDSRLNKAGEEIILKVVCELINDGPYKHQEMRYYVNGVEIAHDDRSNMYESMMRIGFMVNPGSEIDVDYIHVHGTPLEVETIYVTEVDSSPIGASPSGSAVIKTIKAGDNIYANVFLTTTFQDLMGGTEHRVIMRESIYVDGEEVSTYKWTMQAEDIRNQGANFHVPISPIIEGIKYPNQAFTLAEDLSNLRSGVHDVKLVVAYRKMDLSEEKTLGEVSFKFDNTIDSGREKFKKTVFEYRYAYLKRVKMPLPKMNNSAIESGVKKAIIDAGWKQIPLKVVILESNWHTVTSEYYGNILRREINVAVSVKAADGTCIIFYPSVYQEYQGGSKYSSTIVLGGMHKIEEEIDCGNVN